MIQHKIIADRYSCIFEWRKSYISLSSCAVEMRRTLFRWNPNTQNKADTSSFTVEDVATQLIRCCYFVQTIVTMSEFFSTEVRAGVGVVWGQSGPWTPALLCKLLPSNHHPADSRPLTNICMRFEDKQKMFFLLVDLRPPLQSRGVVMNSRSSGLVYGELGTPSREVWERRNHQFWTHSSQNRLPLESS